MALLWISLLAAVVFALLIDWVSRLQRASGPRGGEAIGHAAPPATGPMPAPAPSADRRTQPLPFVGKDRRQVAAVKLPGHAQDDTTGATPTQPELPRRAA